VFFGISHLNLDVKGRLAIPAKYRDALSERCQGQVVVTAHVDPCLLIYPLPDWSAIQKTFEDAPDLDPRVRQWMRRLIAYGEPLELDAAGRVLISPALREHAKLGKEVVLAGIGRKFELWSREGWDRTQKEMPPLSADMLPPQLQGLSL
jgi:MraZ protein